MGKKLLCSQLNSKLKLMGGNMVSNTKVINEIELFREAKVYWESKLSGLQSETIISADFLAKGEYEAGFYETEVSRELTERLASISKNNDLALYVVLLSGLKITLKKYTSQNEIIVVSPRYRQKEVDNKFADNEFIILSDTVQDAISIRELLRNIKTTVLDAYKNQFYPVERIFEDLELNFRQFSSNSFGLALSSIHEVYSDSYNGKIAFYVTKKDSCLELRVKYNSKDYTHKTIKRLVESYLNILNQVTMNIDTEVQNLEIIAEEEKQLIMEFNNTFLDYPRQKTIHDLFQAQAEHIPSRIAVVFGDRKLTYEELNKRSNQIARLLRVKGVKSGSIVGLMVRRSVEMLIGIMGILKAGGAYLPIDPEYPEDRIDYMLEDSKAHILLTESTSCEKVKFQGEKIDLTDEKISWQSSQNLENINGAEDLAYVIYTSGSTGKPKGVMIEHRQVVNFIEGISKRLDLTSWKTILCVTTISFDIFVLETLVPLVTGLKVVIANESEQMDSRKLNEVIVKNNVEIVQITPSRLQMLMLNETFEQTIKSIKMLMIGGEALPAQTIEKLGDNSKLKVFNMYGPTETTVWSTVKEITTKDQITIGSPIANTQVYILDNNMKQQPVGVQGEIYIAGEGLARGYLNNDELTGKRFVENPFVKDGRMYKTGDLGKWLENGEIEFLGRADYQVKIRGYRIELGEIENLINAYEGVERAVVIDREDESHIKYLCAYIVSSNGVSNEELKEYLTKKLPEYMVPTYFIRIEIMPLTPNGKVDRKRLPVPENYIGMITEYAAPRDDIEEKLTGIWSEVFGREKVGIDDNFFELGGHSLKATILASKINKELNVEVPLGEIFNSPSIRKIGNYIKSLGKSMYKTILKAEKKDYYEASLVQNRMYMLQQLDLKSIGYNMPVCFEVVGDLDVAVLNKSVKELIRRHEILRTSFEVLGDKIVQNIKDHIDFNIEYMEKENIDLEKFVKEYIKPFDLNSGPLLRMCVIKIEKNKHILLFDMHHIISDGLSLTIMGDEVLRIYKGELLEEPILQYKDYSEWQKELIKSGELKKQEEYWTDQFSGEIPVLNIPTDYERPAIKSFHGDEYVLRLHRDLVKSLKTLVKDTESTMYVILVSALNILLSRYSGQEDIVIGSPISGRTRIDFEKVIGMFINTIALRNFPAEDKTYERFLKEVKENSFMAFENQDYEFKELLDKLAIPQDISRNPLFDVMFVMQNIEVTRADFNGLTFTPYYAKQNVAKLDITFTAKEYEEDVVLVIQYCTELFKKESIERMMGHFINVLKQITDNRHIKLGEIDILSMEERAKLLYEFNSTYLDYSKDNPIHKMFEEQVKRTPENVALVYYDQKLTYKELDIKSNILAKKLREQGVKRDSIVALIVEPSLEMIVGIMGILKAGGAYLPISPEYPDDRIEYMLQDSGANVILTQSKFLELIAFNGRVLDLCDEEIFVGSGEELANINELSDLVYVIYTSGTTGKPKGVMIEHKNLLAYVMAFLNEYKLSEKDNVLQQANYSFDAFIEEVFPALTVGGKVFIVNKYDALDTSKLQELILKNKINLISCSPLFLNELNKCSGLESIHTFISGGDVLKSEYFNNLIKYSNVYNTCGPTEATVCYSYYKCPEKINGSIPIGKPIANYKIYILDKSSNLSPIGVAGEIFIAGHGLARGYLNSPTLTAEKFIDNPFSPGEKMYKTGDLGRWISDGNIEFLGRLDYQVKIRGFRVELGEIENQLLKYEGIKEAVVLDREDSNGGKYLCAYIAAVKELTIAALRESLSKSLPEYMIPSYFIQLDKIPQTINGKVDRRALLGLNANLVTGVEYEAPRNETEKKLSEIWCQILGVSEAGIKDNFFDLGGHSLKATALISRIHKEFNVEMPLREVFVSPTIKGLSTYIKRTERSIYESIKPAEIKEYYNVSAAQKRMYMLQQFNLLSTAYNMPRVVEVNGKLNKADIEEAFRTLIKRHETLRTAFITIEGKIMQKIDQNTDFQLQYIEKNRKYVDEAVKEFVKPFDLSKAPLFRAGLIKLEEDSYILMFDMHHIISDGVSMEILVNEFIKLCTGNRLEELKLQYKDYSEWQNNMFESERIKKQEEYWINTFSDEVPVLNLPTDYVRPAIQSLEGENIGFKLDKVVTKDLRRIARETGTTMYMVILSGIYILLSKYSGQEDIVVGSTIAGRPHADLEKIIGMFVNTLALRNYPEGNKNYKQFLLEVKENALKAYENQEYQFEELVDKINIRRDISRNPLFDVMFTMQSSTQSTALSIDNSSILDKEFSIKAYRQQHKVSKFDLTFAANEVDEEVFVSLEYCTKLFKKETMERMINHLIVVLKAIAFDIDIKLSEIKVITEKEQYQILHEFNDTYADFDNSKTIQQFFEEQVEKTPNNIAVVFEDKKLTYKELNERVNRLARTLRVKGVRSDDIVAIIAERSLEMLIGILSIIKAGGAYLPIDPEYPEDRIKYICEDSKANIILTQNKFMEKVLLFGQTIDLEDAAVYSDNAENLEIINTSKDLAYVIYTSGSTGQPKGVMIEHHSVINRINWMQKSFPICEKDVILQKTTYTFDVSVWELFWWSFVGSSVCLLPPKGERDPEIILKYIEKNNITTMHFVPSMFNGFMLYVYVKEEKNRLSGLRQVFCSGEALTNNQVEMFRSLTESIRLINLYGPTEATVDVSYYECIKEERFNSVPIGKPIDNIGLYIIGNNNELQPIGVAGELCISGVGLARGYLNKAELTKEKFVDNPFARGERMYKTGDLARWLPDGNIEYLGRIDSQVKIRGFRIELGEIEAVLSKHPSVKEAVVVARNIKGELNNRRLVAYLTAEGEEKPTDELLRSFLKSKLPDYMIPSFFITIEDIPLTQNGKINIKGLPEPNSESFNTEQNYVPPSTPTERILVDIWTKILNVDKIGIHNNFFNLGGDSILSIQLVSRAKEKGLNLSVQQVFLDPTISGLAAQLDAEKSEVAHKEKIQAFGLLSEKDRAKLFKLNNQQESLNKRSE
jgi:tyrocidine synthetase-3